MAFIYATGGGGSGTFTGGTISGATTVAAATSFAVTTADQLTCGGLIVPQTKTVCIPLEANGALSSAASDNIFISDEAYQITSIKLVYADNGNTGISMQFQKLTGTTAPGSGTDLLQSALALDGTANTVLTGTLTATGADLQLAVGNRLGYKLTGGLTANNGIFAITITLKRI